MPYQLGYPRRSNPIQPFKRFANSNNQDFHSVVSGGVPFYDLVWEVATNPGTGNVTLLGAPAGTPYQTFASVMQNNQLTLYRIGDSNGNFEVGFGIWLTGGVLVRQQVLQSNNSDQLVNFTGSVNVMQVAPADWANWVDAATRANSQALSNLQTTVANNGTTPAPFLGDWRNLLIQNYPVPSSVGQTFSVYQMQFSPTPMASFFEVVLNNNGQAMKVQSTGFIIDYRNTGVNGTDGSAYPVSGWVYFWVISNGSNVAGLVSASSTAPTLPNGYTWKALVGSYSTFGSTSNTFTQVFYQINKTAYAINLGLITTGTVGTVAGVQVNTTRICPLATKIICQVGSSVASDACESWWSGDLQQQSGQVVVLPALTALVNGEWANLVTITIPIFTPQTFWWGAYNTNANNYCLQLGWGYD